MLQISTKGRYALRAMLDVALNNDGGPVSRQDIARRQEISAEYVAQLARGLRAAGLLRGVKGTGGGYELARQPADILVGDVLRAVEGPVRVARCVNSDEDESACGRVEDCVTHGLWVNLSIVIDRYIDSVTLQDLMEQAASVTA